MRFFEAIETGEYRGAIDKSHLEARGAGEWAQAQGSRVHPEAILLGRPAAIGSEVGIGLSVIEQNVELQHDSRIGDRSYIGYSSCIGAGVSVGSEVYIGERAFLAPRPIVRGSTAQYDGRYTGIESSAIIGHEVFIPSGVSIPNGQVIPHSDTIEAFGGHGANNATVAVYGTPHGPRYSVRCQRGIDLETFRGRVAGADGTNPESAARYKAYVRPGGAFEEAGRAVQEAYNDYRPLVEELTEARDQALREVDRQFMA